MPTLAAPVALPAGAREQKGQPRMGSMLKRVRKIPLFPILPFGPLFFAGGLVALEVFTLARVRKLARSVDELLRAQRPEPPLAPA